MNVRFGGQDFRTPVFGSGRPAQGSTNILSLCPEAILPRKFPMVGSAQQERQINPHGHGVAMIWRGNDEAGGHYE